MTPVPTHPPTSRREPVPLRLLTYNTYFFPQKQAMFAMIDEVRPDIVCLQEVLCHHPAIPSPNQAEAIARELGYPHCACNLNWKRIVGTSGNAIVSRRPPESIEILRDFQGYAFGVAAVFRHDNQRFAVLMVHLMWVTRPLPIGVFTTIPRRSAQIRQALHWIRRCGLPCILAGDFNVMPHWPEYRLVARRMTDCTRLVPHPRRVTRPTWGVPIQLDYIFVTPQIQPRRCEIIDVQYSDHRPVFADLIIADT